MAQTVIGIFDNASKAEDAVQELVNAGISRDRIDVSSRDNAAGYTSDNYSNTDQEESGITKFFKSLFGDDDDDADKYSRAASGAQSIITVHAQSGDEAERVADILDDNGAVDVDEHAARYGYTSRGSNVSNAGSTDYSDLTAGTDYSNRTNADTTTGYAATTGVSNDETTKIPIVEENLEVGKREVRTGGVRLRSRIIERPVEESVRLRYERVNVERTPVDRPATEADFSNLGEKEIEIVERAEVPVVNKQARVVEEVSLNKEVEERNETIRDTVRKTEVDVEDIDRTDATNRLGNNDVSSGSTGL